MQFTYITGSRSVREIASSFILWVYLPGGEHLICVGNPENIEDCYARQAPQLAKFLVRSEGIVPPERVRKQMDWRDKAACLTVDPELFFPVGNTGPAVDQIDRAKSVCSHCPVTEYCLQYALDTNQDSGVWGGLSEDERRALKRRAARARRAS